MHVYVCTCVYVCVLCVCVGVYVCMSVYMYVCVVHMWRSEVDIGCFLLFSIIFKNVFVLSCV